MNLPRKRKREPMGVRQSDVIRCPGHLAYIRSLECACQRPIVLCWHDVEAAHVRIGTDGGIGQKPSDCFTLPLCSEHHKEQHQIGERAFEAKYNIDMKKIAKALWQQSPAGKRYRMKKEPDTNER